VPVAVELHEPTKYISSSAGDGPLEMFYIPPGTISFQMFKKYVPERSVETIKATTSNEPTHPTSTSVQTETPEISMGPFKHNLREWAHMYIVKSMK
jgi:hypothetical protein